MRCLAAKIDACEHRVTGCSRHHLNKEALNTEVSRAELPIAFVEGDARPAERGRAYFPGYALAICPSVGRMISVSFTRRAQ